MKNLFFLCFVVFLFSQCKKDVNHDTARLDSRATEFTSFQYEDNRALVADFKWRHFKWADNRLFFDSIPNRFKFEEVRPERIALIKAFNQRVPTLSIAGERQHWGNCNYYMAVGGFDGYVSDGAKTFQWSLDPDAQCNEETMRIFHGELLTFFEKMNK